MHSPAKEIEGRLESVLVDGHVGSQMGPGESSGKLLRTLVIKQKTGIKTKLPSISHFFSMG